MDVKKAHLNPRCQQDVYNELPAEAEGGPEMCGKSNLWSYGCRPAASAWEDHYSKKLEHAGFVGGKACAVLFYHEEKGLSLAVHGDDFTFCGTDGELKWITKQMQEWYEIKVRAILGQNDGDDKEVVILGRTVKWCPWGISWEADKKHRKLLMEKFGYDEKTKPLTSNGDTETHHDDDEEKQLVTRSEATEFRGAVARVIFLSQDSPELMYPANELSTEMANPVIGAWKRLKRNARFVKARKSVIWDFPWQDECKEVNVYADSDWGGRGGSRKSTSGGLVMIGNHCVKTWSTTQGAYALSSAEAEFYAMIEAVIKAKGVSHVMVE